MSFRLIRHLELLVKQTAVCSIRRKIWDPNLMPKRAYFPGPKKNQTNFIVPHRTYCWGGIPKKPNEASYKEADAIPEEYNLIYKTGVDKFVKWGYLLACISTALLGGAVLYKYDYKNYQVFLTSHKAEPLDNELLFYMAVYIFIFVVIHTFVRQVPIRIYNMPLKKKYIFVFNGGIPLTIKKAKCYKGQVVKFRSSEILNDLLPWNASAYLLSNSQKILLFEDSFRTPADLYVLLGNQDDYDCE